MKPMSVVVSAVIPTYNSYLSLRAAITSLNNQSVKPVEIIVVNNGSTDQTVQDVKTHFPKAKFINLDKNLGVTGGRNTGLKFMDKKSNFVLFFDHDMVADRSMIEGLLKAINLKPEYGIATPKIGYLQSKDYIWSAGTNINLWTGRVLFRGGKDLGQFDKNEVVQVAPAAFLVKREVINKIGNFDERYFATFEDTDFCFRAKKQGFLTIYTPYGLAYHDISNDSKFTASRLLSRAYYVGRNRIIFMKDHGKNFALFLLISPIYLLYFIYLGVNQRNLKGVVDYGRGFMVGLRDCLKEI